MPRAPRATQAKHLESAADSIGCRVLRQRTTSKAVALSISTEVVRTDRSRVTKKGAGDSDAVAVKAEPGLPRPPRSRTSRGSKKSRTVEPKLEPIAATGQLTAEVIEAAPAAGAAASAEYLSVRAYAYVSSATGQGAAPKSDVQHCVGAHVSAAGGVDKAVLNAKAIGCRAFALFLKSQRQWAAKPLEEEVVTKFRKACVEHNYPPHLILPHGSYLLNCGAPDGEILAKSRAALLDELQRCERLGLLLYNFHPGSTCGEITVEQCMDRIAESINYAHSHTTYVQTVIENMSCQGNTIGGKFEELASIIDRVKDKSRVGVCIDTCHAYAAGYDLSTVEGYETMMTTFDSVVGLKYLKGMHLNDSKGNLGCHLDRHANIGKGCIGLEGFRRIMSDTRLQNIPLIMETPFTSDEGYAEEIRLLYSLC